MVYSIRVDDALAERLDRWRTIHMPLRSRSEAVRALIEQALDQEEIDNECAY